MFALDSYNLCPLQSYNLTRFSSYLVENNFNYKNRIWALAGGGEEMYVCVEQANRKIIIHTSIVALLKPLTWVLWELVVQK